MAKEKVQKRKGAKIKGAKKERCKKKRCKKERCKTKNKILKTCCSCPFSRENKKQIKTNGFLFSFLKENSKQKLDFISLAP